MYIMLSSAMRIRQPTLVWNPEEMSPEIQNRGASGPKKGHVSVKNFFKKKRKINTNATSELVVLVDKIIYEICANFSF